MRALRLCTDGVGRSKLESLALPFVAPGPSATDDDRARMPKPELVREYRSVRAVRRSGGPLADTRSLAFVVSGEIEVAAAYQTARLGPGDVVFVDDASSAGHSVTYHGDCRVVLLDVADAWAPTGIVPPAVDEARRAASAAPLAQRMYVEADQARFRAVDELFADDDEQSRSVLAASFLWLSPDMFGDWHTETNTSLVFVLGGGFELEVGGGGGDVKVFRAGDVCLVQDFEGQGHITRTHGETWFVAIVIDPANAW